ncbi:hypothetical protein F3K02_06585 [Hydrogenophaga sp. D2P1]|jgi:hypothetical protein|uniref:Piwi domain-containing protein n=1 Tax=Hydrogenophaga aromaticivorans TaxID=2610898 RepID=A0A7Y8GU89_9BURK|nr:MULTISPECIES: hypothetical protein [Hydrogenophaga]MCG2655919.1 hypothetical protein [Hydrogenophaga sp.]NWF44917.1 hypothetical protein [Hydrogenophaga aromaticivorans]
MSRPLRPQIQYIEEPKLEFRYGQMLEYSRDGLYLYGPVDASLNPRPVRYGFIGTRAGLERFERWAIQVSSFIATPPPRRGSKAVEPHHVPFPGFSEAFNALWSTKPSKVIDDLDEEELRRRIHIANRHEAIKSVVDAYVERLVADQRRDEDPPAFWYVVIPEFIYELGRPQSVVRIADRVDGKITLKERDALKLAKQPNLFGFDEEDAEVYKYERNFRRQLKARLLDHKIVTQLVRESTLAPGDFLKSNGQPKRNVEDPATLAWKLCSGSYYKSGGRPWQIAAMRPGVCYVGLVYKKQSDADASRFSVCAAQMFLSDGEGVVFRGALGPWFHPDTKQFHLDADSATRLVATVLNEYRTRHGKDPAELFIHAKSSFNDDEWAGFQSACLGATTNVVGVQISDAWDQLKLFRPGAYPVIRGTALITSERAGFLWTSGFVPRLGTYMGPDTPNPLQVTVRRGKAQLQTVMRDVLALSKINFNTCLFNDRSPVTIKFADAIGEILVAAPQSSEPMLPFKFYI